MVQIGVFALQGSVSEHMKSLWRVEGILPREVRNTGDLKKISGLILPGGESTTMGKLMRDFGLDGPIKEKAQNGMPVWGTCAGMILMAGEIANEDYIHLGIMDITVRRNAYGSQLDSFCTGALIPEVSGTEIPLVFIRGPRI